MWRAQQSRRDWLIWNSAEHPDLLFLSFFRLIDINDQLSTFAWNLVVSGAKIAE